MSGEAVLVTGANGLILAERLLDRDDKSRKLSRVGPRLWRGSDKGKPRAFFFDDGIGAVISAFEAPSLGQQVYNRAR